MLTEVPPRRSKLAAELPDFPWDTIAAARATAQAHPGGIVDLSIGTPVDPTPERAIQTLSRAGNSPGYPLTAGTAALRQAIASYLIHRWGAAGLGPGLLLPGRDHARPDHGQPGLRRAAAVPGRPETDRGLDREGSCCVYALEADPKLRRGHCGTALHPPLHTTIAQSLNLEHELHHTGS